MNVYLSQAMINVESHEALDSGRYSLIYVNDYLIYSREKVLLFADADTLISQRSHSQTLQRNRMKAIEWS